MTWGYENITLFLTDAGDCNYDICIAFYYVVTAYLDAGTAIKKTFCQ